MKISIITVTYNSEKTISETLNSLIKQTYNDIEFILIDGNSTDKTINIVNSFNPKVFNKILIEPDNGMYDALNKGIKLSTGEIVGILNSDDVFSENTIISIIANQFKDNPNLDAIIGDVAFVENNKTIRYISPKRWTIKSFYFGNMPPHPSFYCKKDLFEKHGYYKINYKIAGDFELLLRFILVKKITFKYLPIKMVNMKTGGLSTSGLKSTLKINKEILHSFKENELKTNYLFLYFRYFKKVFQYFR
jgi:glycosyltransferase involved in cell wall biosynthesis